jgi:hypothetical protein
MNSSERLLATRIALLLLALAPDIVAQIQAKYPEDEATGFKLDDLRGVFWVEYPAAE